MRGTFCYPPLAGNAFSVKPFKKFSLITHLDNRIRGVTGTIPRAAERRTGPRDDGAGRSDPRIPLALPWQAGARRCRAGTMRLPLRPPTDLRGSPCGMRQPSTGSGAVGLCSRSHRRSGILPVPGMRGKYGTQQSYREPSNRAFLSYDSPNHSGAAAPSFVD